MFRADYRDFTADPVKTLSRFEPEQIFQIRPSGPDGRAPFSIDDAPDLNGPRFALRPNELGPKMQLKLVGRGSVEPAKAAQGGARLSKVKGTPQTWVAEDSVGFLHRASSTGACWLLAPFVDPGVEADAEVFMNALAAEKKMTVADLKIWLKKVANVKQLVTHGLPHLVAAYNEVAKDLNVTSLSLYSGPLPLEVLSAPPSSMKVAFRTVKHQYQPDNDRAAWLGTGDAALKNDEKRKAFLRHYGKLLDQVCTFVLPHHGSEGNFDAELLQVIQPVLCVAAADRFSKWRHPGTAVVQAVASAGLWLLVVTSAPVSVVAERVQLG